MQAHEKLQKTNEELQQVVHIEMFAKGGRENPYPIHVHAQANPQPFSRAINICS